MGGYMAKKYFKVNENNIEKREYIVIDHNETVFEELLLNQIFDKYDVPKEYRFLFFYKSFINNDLKEFITDTPLSYIKTVMDDNIYKINRKTEKEVHTFYNIKNVSITDKEFIHKFFFRMDENNYMDRYLKALNEYFTLKLDSYNITRVSDSEDILSDKKRFIKRVIKKNNK
jgi:hypothetical protein